MWWTKLIIQAKINREMRKNLPDLGIDPIEGKEKLKLNVNGREKRVRFKYSYVKGDSKNLVVWLHGFMSNAKGWYLPGQYSTRGWIGTYTKLDPRPDFLSFSFDRSWMASNLEEREKGDKEASIDNLTIILNHLIEKFVLDPKKIILAGTSMGGFNAIQWWKHKPFIFDAAAFHVPLMKEPWASMALVDLLIRGQFKTEEWTKVNPLSKSFKLDNTLPQVHLQYSELDEFGLFEPNKRFKQRLDEGGVINSGAVNTGDHKDMDTHAMADFINGVLNSVKED